MEPGDFSNAQVAALIVVIAGTVAWLVIAATSDADGWRRHITVLWTALLVFALLLLARMTGRGTTSQGWSWYCQICGCIEPRWMAEIRLLAKRWEMEPGRVAMALNAESI